MNIALLTTNICAQDGPKVLQDISFHVRAGERVGIGMLSHSIPKFMLTLLRVRSRQNR